MDRELLQHEVLVGSIALTNLPASQVLDQVFDNVGRSSQFTVCTPNLDFLAKTRKNDVLTNLVNSCSLRLTDGWLLQLLSALQGTGPLHRFPGSDLVPRVAERAALSGIPVVLTGGPHRHAHEAACTLQRAYPALSSYGVDLPYLNDLAKDPLPELESVLSKIGPAIVFTGLGFPRQEALNLRLAAKWPECVFIGVGAGISFAARRVPRAPQLVRRLYLEWMFRLLTNPRRLARRYLVEDLPALLILAARIVWLRLAHRLGALG